MNSLEIELLRRLRRTINSKNVRLQADVQFEQGAWASLHLKGTVRVDARSNDSYVMRLHVFASIPPEILKAAKVELGDPFPTQTEEGTSNGNG